MFKKKKKKRKKDLRRRQKRTKMRGTHTGTFLSAECTLQHSEWLFLRGQATYSRLRRPADVCSRAVAARSVSLDSAELLSAACTFLVERLCTKRLASQNSATPSQGKDLAAFVGSAALPLRQCPSCRPLLLLRTKRNKRRTQWKSCRRRG